MHWFGELLGIYALIAGVGFTVLYIRAFPLIRLRQKRAKLEYITRLDLHRAYLKLFNANASAISAIECGLAPGFPDEIREQMLAAHESASKAMEGNAT